MTEQETQAIEERVRKLKSKYELEENRDLSTGIPESGKWYVHKMFLSNGKTRYFISKLPREKTFESSKRLVFTKYGVDTGKGAPIVSRFVNFLEDYDSRKLSGVYEIVSCPEYVRSNVEVSKMTDAVSDEDMEIIADTMELNAALRLIDVVRRERARANNAEQEAEKWKELVTKVGARFGRKALELWLEGDSATAEQMMEMKEGFDFGRIKEWIKENYLQVGIVLVIGLAAITKALGVW